MIARLLAVLLVIPAVGALAGAEDIILDPGVPTDVGPVEGPVVQGPAVGPYGPCWGQGHWIYDYLPSYDHQAERYGVGLDLNRRYENRSGLKTYAGRSTLDPAVPYSDYLAQQRRLQASVPPAPAAAVMPSADRAILEFTLPTASATLWLDGQRIDGEGRVRTMQTPPLVAGQEYKFTVKAVWPSLTSPVDEHSFEQIVTFRAGERKPIEIRAKN
jgi:uncharacterized protein (TIGR03000 family)